MRLIFRFLIIYLLLVMVACSQHSSYKLEKGELFPGSKPIGQPYTSKQPDIRMVKVVSVFEADSFYKALREIYPDCEMSYTHDVLSGTYEVGIIQIIDSDINHSGIKEIHFVEAIKIGK